MISHEVGDNVWRRCSRRRSSTISQTRQFMASQPTGKCGSSGNCTGGAFIQDLRTFTLEDIDNVGAALHFVFAQCREQVMRLYAAI